MSIINNLAGAGSMMPTIRVTAPYGSSVTCDGVQGTPRGSGSTQTFDFKVPFKRSTNPAWRGLPSGYKQVEYISSSGTQYIIIQKSYSSTAKMYCNFTPLSTSSTQAIATWNNVGLYYIGSNTEIQAGFSNTKKGCLGCTANILYHTETDFSNSTLKVDDKAIRTLSDSNSPSGNLYLFKRNDGLPATISMDTYYIIDNGIKTLDLVPCLNISTNKYGMYDMVSNTFFGDANGGDFTAGYEVSQYIDVPYTIVATSQDQTKTKTVSVVVDEVALFPVEIEYIPSGALYWLGDECTTLTGGWNNSINAGYGSALDKYDTYMKSQLATTWCARTTSYIVDLSGYSYLKMEYEATDNVRQACELAIYSSVPQSWDSGMVKNQESVVTTSGTYTVSIPLTNYQGSYAVGIKANANTDKFYKVWLE